MALKKKTNFEMIWSLQTKKSVRDKVNFGLGFHFIIFDAMSNVCFVPMRILKRTLKLAKCRYLVNDKLCRRRAPS